jgi:hypothetical protein
MEESSSESDFFNQLLEELGLSADMDNENKTWLGMNGINTTFCDVGMGQNPGT